MKKKHTITDEIDPYSILGLVSTASENEIQNQFHKLMQNNDDPEMIIKAYSMIRNEVGRITWRWDGLYSRIADPSEEPANDQDALDLEALIKEMAFLCPWELGEDEHGI